jgi:AraC family transcriptional regulator
MTTASPGPPQAGPRLRPPLRELLVPGAIRASARHYALPASALSGVVGGEHILAVHLHGDALVEQRPDAGGWRGAILAPGRVTILPAFRPSSWRLHGGAEFFHLAFPAGDVEELARDEGLLAPGRALALSPLFGAEDPLLARLALAVRTQLVEPQALSRLFVETALRLLLVHALQRHAELRAAAPARGPLLDRPALRRAVELVEARLADDLGLTDLAAAAGLTPLAFSKAFKRAAGVSPYRYVLQRRVEVAKCLLRETDLPVIEVGARVGFENPQHFARVFRRFAGTSPRTFRRQS